MIVETTLSDTGCMNILRPNPTLPRGNGYKSKVARDAAIAWNFLKESLPPSNGRSAIDRLVIDACLEALKQEREEACAAIGEGGAAPHA